MLPKFDERPMRMYFIVFPNVFRPSRMPSFRIFKLFCVMTMSADSRATSSAFETEIPTSALRSDGASLMPSPM